MWRRAGDAGGGWCQLPSPPGQQSHWSEHSDELCQRPQCQIFQCTIVFQCTSHTVLMRIEQSTLLFLCWRWWSTEAASCCTFPRRLKRATQSDRAALLSFPLLICSQPDVIACTYLAQIEFAHCTKSWLHCAILSTSSVICHPLLLLPLYISGQFKPSFYFCTI